MPPGVVGEQIKGGMYPGEKFLKFTPRGLQILNEKKGTTQLYFEFSNAVVEEGGGKNMTGWESKKIHQVVSRFQPQFNEKGVAIAYYMVRWWVSHGPQGGHHEHRHWMTYTDIGAVQGTPVIEGAFDANKDYEKMDADEEKLFKSDEPFVVLGTAVEGQFQSFDPAGKWVADMSTATNELASWVASMEFTAVKEGNIYNGSGKYKFGAKCLWFSGKMAFTLQPVPGKTNTFLCITAEGEYLECVLESADAFRSTQTSKKSGDSVVWRRSK